MLQGFHVQQTGSMLCAGTLTARMDRTEAARLYAGNVEYGYFVREMLQRCQDSGMPAESNPDHLISMAASLPQDQLRCYITFSLCCCC